MKLRKFITYFLVVAMLVTYIPDMSFAADISNNDSTYRPVVIAQQITPSKKSVKLKWKKTIGATKYVVYGSRSNKKFYKIKTIKAGSSRTFVVKKINKKRLKNHSIYRFYIRAYNGKTLLAKSRTYAVITGNTKGKYANPKSIKSKIENLELKAGDELKFSDFGIKVTLPKGKKHISSKYAKKYSFASDSKYIDIDTKKKIISISDNAVEEQTGNIFIEGISGKVISLKASISQAERKEEPVEPETPYSVQKTQLTIKENGGDTSGSGYVNSQATSFDADGFIAPTRYLWDVDYYFTMDSSVEVPIASADGKLVNFAAGYITDGKWTYKGANLTIYPKWKEITSKITIHAMGGTFNGSEISDITINLSTQKIVSSGGAATPEVKKTGYDFIGYWTTSDDSGCKIIEDDGDFTESVLNYTDKSGKWIRTEDTDLYIHWKPKTYDVRLEAGEGTGTKDGTISVTYDSSDAKVDSLAEKKGYKCTGYFTNASGNADGDIQILSADGSLLNLWNFSETDKLYAHWTPNEYKLTLKDMRFMGGGHLDIIKKYYYETTASAQDISGFPSQTGYILKGYYDSYDEDLDNNGSGRQVISISDQSVKLMSCDGIIEEVDIGSGEKSLKWASSNDVTLYANWKPKTYTITLDGNGGDTSANVTIDYDAGQINNIGDSPLLIRDNFVCTGFYTTSGDGGEMILTPNGRLNDNLTVPGWCESGKWKKAEDSKLYAHWKDNCSKIKLVANYVGGTNGAAVAKKDDVKIDIMAGVENRKGWKFLGYFSSADGGLLIASADGSLNKGISTSYLSSDGKWIGEVNALVTLYAHWEAKTINLTFRDAKFGNGSYHADKTFEINYESGDLPSGMMGPGAAKDLTQKGYKLTGFYSSCDAAGNGIGKKIVEFPESAPPKFVQSSGYVQYDTTQIPNVLKWIRDIDTVLYAGWEAKDCSILFKDNKFDHVSKNLSVKYDSHDMNAKMKDAKVMTGLSQAGYNMTGFYTSCDASGNGIGNLVVDTSSEIAFVRCEGVVSADADGKLCWVRDSEITLYAHWEPKQIQITFKDRKFGAADYHQDIKGLINYDASDLPNEIKASIKLTQRGYSLTGYYNHLDNNTKNGNDTKVINIEDDGAHFVSSDGYVKLDAAGQLRWIREYGTTLYAHWEPKTTTIKVPTGSCSNQFETSVEFDSDMISISEAPISLNPDKPRFVGFEDQQGKQICDKKGNILLDSESSYVKSGKWNCDLESVVLKPIFREKLINIGGKIYYVDTTVTDCEYKFYDINEDEIIGWNTGENASNGTKAAQYLIDQGAVSYEILKPSSKDKIYVFATDENGALYEYKQHHPNTSTDSVEWGSYGVDLETITDTGYHFIDDRLAQCDKSMGDGDQNTYLILVLGSLQIQDFKVFTVENNSNETVWNWLKNTVNSSAGVNGYKDWYIPSIQEIEKMNLCNRAFAYDNSNSKLYELDIFDQSNIGSTGDWNRNVWTSVEGNSNTAYSWNYTSQKWEKCEKKASSIGAVIVRAF